MDASRFKRWVRNNSVAVAIASAVLSTSSLAFVPYLVGAFITWLILLMIRVTLVSKYVLMFMILLNPCVVGEDCGGTPCCKYHVGNSVIEVPEDAVVKEINLDLMGMFQSFFVIAILYYAAHLVFLSSSPSGRAQAKTKLLGLLVGMVLVANSRLILQLVITISEGISNDILATANDRLPALLNMGSMLNVNMCMMDMLSVSLGMVGILGAAMRYFLMLLMAAFFPLTLFLYFIPTTKNYGIMMIRFTMTIVLIQVMQALVYAVTVITATSQRGIVGFVVAIGGMYGVMYAPLMGMKIMGWIGAVTHFYSTRAGGSATRFMSMLMRGQKLGSALQTAGAQYMIAHNMGPAVRGLPGAPMGASQMGVPGANGGSPPKSTGRSARKISSMIDHRGAGGSASRASGSVGGSPYFVRRDAQQHALSNTAMVPGTGTAVAAANIASKSIGRLGSKVADALVGGKSGAIGVKAGGTGVGGARGAIAGSRAGGGTTAGMASGAASGSRTGASGGGMPGDRAGVAAMAKGAGAESKTLPLGGASKKLFQSDRNEVEGMSQDIKDLEELIRQGGKDSEANEKRLNSLRQRHNEKMHSLHQREQNLERMLGKNDLANEADAAMKPGATDADHKNFQDKAEEKGFKVPEKGTPKEKTEKMLQEMGEQTVKERSGGTAGPALVTPGKAMEVAGAPVGKAPKTSGISQAAKELKIRPPTKGETDILSSVGGGLNSYEGLKKWYGNFGELSKKLGGGISASRLHDIYEMKHWEHNRKAPKQKPDVSAFLGKYGPDAKQTPSLTPQQQEGMSYQESIKKRQRSHEQVNNILRGLNAPEGSDENKFARAWLSTELSNRGGREIKPDELKHFKYEEATTPEYENYMDRSGMPYRLPGVLVVDDAKWFEGMSGRESIQSKLNLKGAGGVHMTGGFMNPALRSIGIQMTAESGKAQLHEDLHQIDNVVTSRKGVDAIFSEIIAFRGDIYSGNRTWANTESALTGYYIDHYTPNATQTEKDKYSRDLKTALATVRTMDDNMGVAPVSHILLHTKTLDEFNRNYSQLTVNELRELGGKQPLSTPEASLGPASETPRPTRGGAGGGRGGTGGGRSGTGSGKTGGQGKTGSGKTGGKGKTGSGKTGGKGQGDAESTGSGATAGAAAGAAAGVGASHLHISHRLHNLEKFTHPDKMPQGVPPMMRMGNAPLANRISDRLDTEEGRLGYLSKLGGWTDLMESKISSWEDSIPEEAKKSPEIKQLMNDAHVTIEAAREGAMMKYREELHAAEQSLRAESRAATSEQAVDDVQSRILDVREELKRTSDIHTALARLGELEGLSEKEEKIKSERSNLKRGGGYKSWGRTKKK